MEAFKTEDKTFFTSHLTGGYISTIVVGPGITQVDRTWMLPSGNSGAAEAKMEIRLFLIAKEINVIIDPRPSSCRMQFFNG